MKLCVNYLEEVKKLIEEGEIDFIDYIKLFSISGDLSPFEWCVSKKNVMFHGLIGDIGSNIADVNFFENRNLELQKYYFEKSNTPYISMHINAMQEPILDEEESLKIIVENVEKLKKEFNKKIILENVPGFKNRGKYNYFANPEFISKVIKKANCGFLLDIGHARAAAEVLQIPFDDYIKRLPMDKLVEIHLAGCMKKKDGSLTPNHSKMNEEDYLFLENLLKTNNTLEVVTLEYGTMKQKDTIDECPLVSYGTVNEKAKKEVLEQLSRLREIIKRSER